MLEKNAIFLYPRYKRMETHQNEMQIKIQIIEILYQIPDMQIQKCCQ
jgi:hypothetical protein